MNDYLDRRTREDSDLVYGTENRKDLLDPGGRGKVIGVLLISCARCEGLGSLRGSRQQRGSRLAALFEQESWEGEGLGCPSRWHLSHQLSVSTRPTRTDLLSFSLSQSPRYVNAVTSGHEHLPNSETYSICFPFMWFMARTASR
jgi:hypothetical protein